MSPALRRFFWRYPAWWTMALAGLGWLYLGAVSYTHLTLPTNREV